jgi:hypothetical protein
MVNSHLESLVLRGVSVLRDGLAVSLRLGSYEVTEPQTTKATPFSKRHPSPGCAAFMPQTSGRLFPNAGRNAGGNGAAPWAGRLSRAGVLSRRSPADSAGWTSVHRWSATVGGPQFTAAVRLCPPWAKQAAPVADASFRRPSPLHDFAIRALGHHGHERQEVPAGITGPATRTPPAASTRGNGCR